MELYFVCPLTGRGYASEDWRIMGEPRVLEDMEGKRRLLGMVEVECPCCGGTHAYSTEELACPLSQAGM
jgi:hypothetical protein